MVVHAGAAPREDPGTAIRSVQANGGGAALSVTIHADGPRPSAARELPRSKDAERYVNQMAAPLGRLNALRPSIAAIASDAAPSPADLLSVAVELDAIRGTLRTMEAPASLATPHDLLMRFCALAFRAAHLRIDPGTAGDPEALRNAASAAAGALIVLHRASHDLGYVPPQ